MSLNDGVLWNESRGSMRPGIWGDGGQAAGPMQVHPAALADVNARLGTTYTHAQLAANPAIGKLVGDTYLGMMQEEFPGRPDLAVAAYNAGPGTIRAAVAAGKPIPNQQYVDQALAHGGIGPGNGLAGLGAQTPAGAAGSPYAAAQAALADMFHAPADSGSATPQPLANGDGGPQGLGLMSALGAMGTLMAGFKSPVRLIPVDYNPFANAPAKMSDAPLGGGGSALGGLAPLPSLTSGTRR